MLTKTSRQDAVFHVETNRFTAAKIVFQNKQTACNEVLAMEGRTHHRRNLYKQDLDKRQHRHWQKTMSNISNDLFSIWVTHKMVALTDKQVECYQTHLPQTSLNVTNKLTNIITIRMWEGKELRSWIHFPN